MSPIKMFVYIMIIPIGRVMCFRFDFVLYKFIVDGQLGPTMTNDLKTRQ
jgi:hypothetical protein